MAIMKTNFNTLSMNNYVSVNGAVLSRKSCFFPLFGTNLHRSIFKTSKEIIRELPTYKIKYYPNIFCL